MGIVFPFNANIFCIELCEIDKLRLTRTTAIRPWLVELAHQNLDFSERKFVSIATQQILFFSLRSQFARFANFKKANIDN